LRDYAAHLERGRKTFPLFDTRGFAGDFERLLADAYEETTAARVGRASSPRTIGRISG